MANHSPLIEGTAAAGGYTVNPEYGELIIEGMLKQSGFASLVPTRRTSTKETKYPVFKGKPRAYWVGETEAIPNTGAEFGQISVEVFKLAVNIPFSRELLEDTDYDIENVINGAVAEAFAAEYDSTLCGYYERAAIAANPLFGASRLKGLASSTNTVAIGTTPDRLRVAASDLMGAIEENGYNATSIVLPTDANKHIRDARRTVETADRLYVGEDPFYGMTPGSSSNLPLLNSDPAEGKVVGVAFDNSRVWAVVRRDLTVRLLQEATLDGVNLAETDQVATQWTMRIGAVCADPDRAVAVLVDEPAEEPEEE